MVYVSEGKDASVVDALESTAERACATHGARVVNVFRDVEYNRTGFTLGVRVGAEGDAAEPLGAAATALAERALSLVDLRDHAATHPRCGVVDHISCHAVGDADASVAVSLARGIGAPRLELLGGQGASRVLRRDGRLVLSHPLGREFVTNLQQQVRACTNMCMNV